MGESPEKAATRECLEEAGVKCHSLKPLMRYDQGIDVTLSPAFIFECDQYTVDTELAANDETDNRPSSAMAAYRRGRENVNVSMARA